jgi:mono/diheme cytochrome c family protein
MDAQVVGHEFGKFVETGRAATPNGWIRLVGTVFVFLAIFQASATWAGGALVEDEDRAISPEEAAEMISSPESAAAGENLFNQVCVYCHGAKGIGGKARKMQCRDFKSQYLYDVISNGKRRGAYVMPSWKASFNEKTRWELASYIMTLKKLEKCE